jgi:hypothetical protein
VPLKHGVIVRDCPAPGQVPYVMQVEFEVLTTAVDISLSTTRVTGIAVSLEATTELFPPRDRLAIYSSKFPYNQAKYKER